MKFTVLIAPQAEADLKAMLAFLQEREGPRKAEAVMRELKSAVLGLGVVPHRGKEPPELEPFGPTDYLQIVFKRWRIIYFVSGREVHVLLVADGSQDFSTLLSRRIRGMTD